MCYWTKIFLGNIIVSPLAGNVNLKGRNYEIFSHKLIGFRLGVDAKQDQSKHQNNSLKRNPEFTKHLLSKDRKMVKMISQV